MTAGKRRAATRTAGELDQTHASLALPSDWRTLTRVRVLVYKSTTFTPEGRSYYSELYSRRPANLLDAYMVSRPRKSLRLDEAVADVEIPPAPRNNQPELPWLIVSSVAKSFSTNRAIASTAC